ncbi:SDR family NAD(P)-dependent oxidoreductase [Chlorobaculum sp. 24CR]|uniref:SDR family oxidoreductase n=1 Tax=Chlorobaculum sp. 24CR TaxID=2508878 RepID=UPI00100BFCBA|nr:SDR family oxidoreductase [Chlorobaculum sp. 24CR]RXK85179.1 SDR family NAD(P)-dependent oxidoreductase [Chlorobaculum sp. 24CR]
MRKKIVVTGGTGFIGSRLVHRLAAQGEDVHALVRPSSDLASLKECIDNITLVFGDVTDPSSVFKAIEGADEVYHCAGITYMGDRKNPLLQRINVDGTSHVLEACRRAGVKRVVHVSSITAVGISGPNRKFNEESRWNFDMIDLEYARTKYAAEEIVADEVKKGLDCVIVVPAFVFGAGDINFNAGRIIKDVYKRKMPFYPMGGICVVDVEIVVDCLIAAMQRGRTGERYIVGGDNVSFRELAQTIMQVTGVHQSSFPLPVWAAHVISFLLRFSRGRNKISKLFNITMFTVASKFLYFDSSKAQLELGMRYEPFEKSIRRTFEWYRERGMLK